VSQSNIPKLKAPGSQTLLVFNYAMDQSDPIFSHQFDVIVGLAGKFGKVVVITQRQASFALPFNVQVINLHWKTSRSISNSLKFLKVFIRVLIDIKPEIVFSHMTEKLSLIAAPLLKILRIPHFLWYAHTSTSISLKVASNFVDAIFTSTAGSCPIKKSHVRIVGQAIDTAKFRGEAPREMYPKNFVHVGRLDNSKNIDSLIQEVLGENSGNTLTLIGAPSNSEAANYWGMIKSKYEHLLKSGELVAYGPIKRSDLPALLAKYDVFIHAFNGSLDKSILEATACGLPVVTTNPEYLSIFGSWSDELRDHSLGLELRGFLNKPLSFRRSELQRRANLVKTDHSFDSWIDKVTVLLTSGDL
jgi:glycosyltransferase involved in cell wall biosynthesis